MLYEFPLGIWGHQLLYRQGLGKMESMEMWLEGIRVAQDQEQIWLPPEGELYKVKEQLEVVLQQEVAQQQEATKL